MLITLIASPAWTNGVLGWETAGPTGTEAWAHPCHNTITDNMFFSDHTMFGLFTQ